MGEDDGAGEGVCRVGFADIRAGVDSWFLGVVRGRNGWTNS
jgi:hypothetical protein